MTHEKVEDFDRRTQRVSTLSEPATINGTHFPIGTIACAVGTSKMETNYIDFIMPNMASIFLDMAYKAYEETQGYFIYKNLEKAKNNIFHPKDYDKFYHILQYRISNIINSFCALESFMNDSIPEDFIYTSKSGTTRSKQRIEEKYKVSGKFYDIMRKVFDIDGEIDQNIKDKFERIQTIRNRIIHLKRIDTINIPNKDEDTIWIHLLSKDFINYAILVREIITYFYSCKPDMGLRWHKECIF